MNIEGDNYSNNNSLPCLSVSILGHASVPPLQWSKVTTLSKFQWLEQQMDPSNNFSNYRTILKASLSKSPPATATCYTPGDRKSQSAPASDSVHNPFQFPEKPKESHPLQQGTKDEPTRQLMIPFFSLLVKDLYFLNEGCANRLVVSSVADKDESVFVRCSCFARHWLTD